MQETPIVPHGVAFNKRLALRATFRLIWPADAHIAAPSRARCFAAMHSRATGEQECNIRNITWAC